MRYIIVIIISSIIFTACRPYEPDARLVEVSEQISARMPDSALLSLQSIDTASMSRADRQYYRFLTLKATDKAYIIHTSDSTILELVDYYSSHPDLGLYPDALYYAGRVYADLGDNPTALSYFQQAYGAVIETDNFDLRCRVASQLAQMLNILRLYSEAIPYAEDAVKTDRQLNDSISEVYDLHLLGNIYSRSHKYAHAEKYYREAMAKSALLPDPCFMAKARMFMAEIKLDIGDVDSALYFINGTIDAVEPLSRETALSRATNIYMEAERYDSAAVFAKNLLYYNHADSRKTAYNALLDPHLASLVPKDTLMAYITDYKRCINDLFNENESQLAITQQSQFNYEVHDRNRQKAEDSYNNIKRWRYVTVIAILVLLLVVLYLKIRNQQQIIRLQSALEQIETLKRLSCKKPESSDSDSNTKDIPSRNTQPNVTELRQRLQSQLSTIFDTDCSKDATHPEILNSEACKRLYSLIGNQQPIDKNLWSQLQQVIESLHPNLMSNLRLLVRDKLYQADIQTVIMIKCGLTPSQMAIALGRSKSTVVSRRKSLGQKIFDTEVDTEFIDKVIKRM